MEANPQEPLRRTRIPMPALSERLIKQGVAAERLDRVKSPAGLDLGGIDPHEIAISVLAEIIAWRSTTREENAGSQRETG